MPGPRHLPSDPVRGGPPPTPPARCGGLGAPTPPPPGGGTDHSVIEDRQSDLNGDNTIYLDRDSTTHVVQGPGLSSDDPSDTVGDKEWDFLNPGQGVLVWHIDDTVLFGVNIPPDGVVNSNPDRHGVADVEADCI